VGTTGGKDFIFAHNLADPLALAAAIIRDAFEYQVQKCSATANRQVQWWDNSLSAGQELQVSIYG
jgi:1-pyrroline-5-carboxylate dehydrogenase